MGKTKDQTKVVRSPRRGLGGPTVADVAKRAGVSPMTVSRVVNDEPVVREKTRAKVAAAIAELGYVPNAAARSLAVGQQCRIALLHSNPSASWLSALLMGCLAEASAHEAQLIVEEYDVQLHGHVETPKAFVERLKAHRIDALLLPSPLCDDPELIGELHQAAIPLALLASGRPVDFAFSVSIDEEAAAHAMTARLIGLGHSRIGFIDSEVGFAAGALRRTGYLRALAEAGIAADPALVAMGDYSYRSGLAAAETLLSLSPRPSAIFASNDDMAAASVAAAHRRGFDVPRDISVCGFDDSAMATTIWPELTTIRQPVGEMAGMAIRLLIDAVRNIAAGRTAELRHEQLAFALIERVSDAAPGTQGV